MSTGKSSYTLATVESYPDILRKVCIGTALRRHRDIVYDRLNRDDKLKIESRFESCLLGRCRGDLLWDTAACYSCVKKDNCPFYTKIRCLRHMDRFCVVTTHDIVSTIYPFTQVTILDEVDVTLKRIRMYSEKYVDHVTKVFPEAEKKVRGLLKRGFSVKKFVVREDGGLRVELFYITPYYDISERVEKRPHVSITATLPVPNPDDPFIKEALDVGVPEEELEMTLQSMVLGLANLILGSFDPFSVFNIIYLHNLLKNDFILVNKGKVYVSQSRGVATALKYTCKIVEKAVEKGYTVGVVAPNYRIAREIKMRVGVKPNVDVIVVGGKESRGINRDKDVVVAWYQYPRPETEAGDLFVKLRMSTFRYFYLPFEAAGIPPSRIVDMLYKITIAAENVQTLFRFIRKSRAGRSHIVVLLDYRMLQAMKWFRSTVEYLRDNESRLAVYSGLVELYKNTVNLL